MFDVQGYTYVTRKPNATESIYDQWVSKLWDPKMEMADATLTVSLHYPLISALF